MNCEKNLFALKQPASGRQGNNSIRIIDLARLQFGVAWQPKEGREGRNYCAEAAVERERQRENPEFGVAQHRNGQKDETQGTNSIALKNCPKNHPKMRPKPNLLQAYII